MASADGAGGAKGPPQAAASTPVPAVACRMLRSPSHESVTTDLSLFSVSSLASDAAAAAAGGSGGSGRGVRLVTFKSYSEAQLAARGPSPNPDSRGHGSTRPADIPEILWFEEENEVIRSCAALSSALGLQKSFSTSDISQLPSPDETPSQPPPRAAVSELALSAAQRSGFLLDHPHLDHASRSCSTWVAVGDVASTSQLPSPHGGQATVAPGPGPGPPPPQQGSAPAQPAQPPPPVTTTPAFTAADLIRSVNKKVRQNYIRRRLLTTYKALERLSQSEFNLDRLEVTPATAAAATAAAAAAVSGSPGAAAAAAAAAATGTAPAPGGGGGLLTVPGAPAGASAAGGGAAPAPAPASASAASASAAAAASSAATSAAVLRVVRQRASKNLPLTIRDVERERGKPLSKYERNMMIFNWLHTLDDSSFEGLQ